MLNNYDSILIYKERCGDCMNCFDTDIQIMQENLCDVRKIAGYTAEGLASKLGVTKQTISNLENEKVKMSRIQYIAIRSVLECETYINKKNVVLKKIMLFLFGGTYEGYIHNRAQIRTAMISISSSSSAGLSDTELYSLMVTLLSPIGYSFDNENKRRGIPTLEWLLRLNEEEEK